MTTTIKSATSSETLTRVLAEIDGRGIELARFKGGKIELYQDYADQPGLPQFIGYVEDVAHHIPAPFWRALQPALAALNEAHAAHWGAYLPGADKWLNRAA